MTMLRVLSAGVDTVHLSAAGELQHGILVCFRQMLELSATDAGPVAFSFGYPDRPEFLLRRHGQHRQPIWLSSPRFEVFFGAESPLPQALVQLHSPYIHSAGVEVAVDEVTAFLRRMVFSGDVALKPSRIDVYADEQGWEPVRQDHERFVCRAIRRRAFEVPAQLHGVGRRLSGFMFGKEAVVARIYDKTLEMQTRGHTWQELLWEGRDAARPVWRVEFQFRRDALRSFHVASVEHALELRQALWEYGMTWLSLRTPTDHHSPNRWPVDPVWTDLGHAWMGSPRSELVRDRLRTADELRLVRGLVGYASSLEALDRRLDLGVVVERHVPSARRYLAVRGEAFGDIVKRKRRRRLELPTVAGGTR